LLRDLSGRTHLGEAAAITLAVEIDNALLITDDLPGRRIATTLGLRCTGTVGLLVASKRAGYLARIAPLLDDLRVRARFWISDDVIRRALELAGESPPAMGE
jgi:predicted nucleic acid-binding protein